MKKLLTVSAVLVLGAVLATPAMAGHRGPRKGHHQRIGRGINLGISGFPVPRFHLPVPRIRSSFSVSFGSPVYRYPVYYEPAPVYYAPRPVYVAPPCEQVWIPAHYAWNDGFRIYIAGHWSSRR